eukprot:GHVH01012048.1.p1 GENE.GHVH01012048.1~~GHVH01012048.1.p1  ORF type:complete len:254 (+),score=44.60 GHVH01012048.1:281-1042(+)
MDYPEELGTEPWRSRDSVFHVPFNHETKDSKEKRRYELKTGSVPWSKKWSKENARKVQEIEGFQLAKLEPKNDWTLTSNYLVTASDAGDRSANTMGDMKTYRLSSNESRIQFKCHDVVLPMNLLSDQSLPILFHDHVTFYQDDLDDCGQIAAEGFIRVMDSFWFCKLQQLIVVDDVFIRLIDVRMFHLFESPNEIMFEWTLREVDLADNGQTFKTNILNAVTSDLMTRQMAIMRYITNSNVTAKYGVMVNFAR